MLEYKSFAHLDLHKTGTTQIKKLCEKYIDEAPVYFKKHAPVGERYSRNKLYVVSIRDPLEQYISLYKYGLDGRGGLFFRLREQGFSELYEPTFDGFVKWISFIDNPENAFLLDHKYSKLTHLHDCLGFISYRLLSFILLDPIKTLSKCSNKDDIFKKLEKLSIANFVIRNEFLEHDFLKFIDICSSDVVVNPIKLRYSKKHISSDIFTQQRSNASHSSLDLSRAYKNVTVKNIISQKEWVYSIYGY